VTENTNRIQARPSQVTPVQALIYLVGCSPSLSEQLTKRLAAADRRFLTATTLQQAEHGFAAHDVQAAVMTLFLPDGDARILLSHLRAVPRTAAVPALVLTGHLPTSFQDEELSFFADDLMADPQDVERIVEWVTMRLRRSVEIARGARRDTATGLMNRAAFRECFERFALENRETPTASTLAIVAIDRPSSILPPDRPDLLQEAMRAVATALSGVTRSSDVVARVSAGEFALLLPDTTIADGEAALRKVLSRLNRLTVQLSNGTSVRFTLSAGLAAAMLNQSFDDNMTIAERHLRLASVSVSSRPPPQSKAQPTRRDGVLLVTPDPGTGTALAKILEREEIQAQIVSPSEAVHVTAKPCLILIDAEQANGNAPQVLQSFRERPQYDRIPVMILSAHDAGSAGLRALERGANEFLARPFPPQLLVSRVRRLLARDIVQCQEAVSYRLLLVDHDPHVLLSAGTAIHQQGAFKVYLARSQSEVEQRFAEAVPDVLLLDMGLEQRQAESIVRLAAREGVAGSRVRIVLGVPPGTNVSPSFVNEHGVSGVIEKPYQLLMIDHQIHTAAGLPARRRGSPPPSDHLNQEIHRVMSSPTEGRPA
jgi:diguanylate cyclase (GGDEF)-like protein